MALIPSAETGSWRTRIMSEAGRATIVPRTSYAAGRMTVPQMPAAKAASSATNRRTTSGRCETGLVLGVPFPVERPDVRVGPQVVAGQDPLATAALTSEICRGPGRGAEGHDQDEDAHRATEAAQKSLARNVEDVGDAGADVVRGGFRQVRLRLRDVLRRLRHRLGCLLHRRRGSPR